MLGRILSAALVGLDAHPVEVETHVAAAMPAFVIVGLPDAAVQESRERVRAAIVNAGFQFPARRVIVNLAPADMRKSGPLLDLPIALSFLAATGQAGAADDAVAAVGELSLDATLRPVAGVMALAEGVRQAGLRGLIVPAANATEAALVAGIHVYPVQTLAEAVRVLACGGAGAATAPPVDVAGLLAAPSAPQTDLADVTGQEVPRRAMEIAVAGGHNLLMVGPPGSGKTMLARRLPGIMPELQAQEALAVTRVHSVAGLLPAGEPLVRRRPFRAPHHSISSAGLIGGGSVPRPGEVSLAHMGVLFLDELAEFRPTALEALRQPLEDGLVTVVRAAGSVTYPARVMLVAAMNPCACGFLGDRERACACTQRRLQQYHARLSGPLLDRIDLRITVGRVPVADLRSARPGESSAVVRRRVCAARHRQTERLARRGDPAQVGDVFVNAHLGTREVRRLCRLSPAAADALDRAYVQLRLSARACERVVKVAQTIADLAGASLIAEEHVRESLVYRGLGVASETCGAA